MAEYNTVQINAIHLTTTGDGTGRPCYIDIPDLLQMRIDPRSVEEDLDGGQHLQFGEPAGFEIPMSIRVMEDDDLTALIDEINDVEDAGNFHNIIIEGDTGNFDLDCALVSLRNSGAFFDGRVSAIDLVFKVDAMNAYTP